MIHKLFILSAFLFWGMTADVFAAGGNLDVGFNGNGKTVFNIESSPIPGNFAEVAVIGGGKFLVAGLAEIASGYYAITLIRCNSDGSLDTSFGAGGKVITDLGASTGGKAIAVQTDGKILVLGTLGEYGPGVVLRYTADGMLDTTFGGNGLFLSSVERANDIKITADNKILVIGYYPSDDQPNHAGVLVARINVDGTADTSFGINGIAASGNSEHSAIKLAIQSDGKIVVSGRTNNTFQRGLVFRFNTNGSLDSTFGTGGVREISGPSGPGSSGSMYIGGGPAFQPDGKIVLSGATSAPFYQGQLFLARLNPDGSTDTSFGGGIVLHDLTTRSDVAHDMALQSDGKILICGHQDDYQGIVARFDSNGALDTGFGTGGVAISTSSGFAAIALQGSNVVAIGGGGFSNDTFISRFNQSGATISFRNEPFVAGKNDQARDVAVQTDGKIVAVGISEGTSVTVASVARLLPDGTLDATFGTGGRVALNDGNFSEANAVEIQPDGKILFAGTYSENSLFRGSLFVVRLNADGTLDNTFGTGGKVIITNVILSFFVGYDLKLQTDGKIVIAGSALRRVDEGNFDSDMLAARLNPNGSRDSGFGNNGVFIFYNGTAQSPSDEQAKALSILPNGKIILAGTHLLRLNADSSVDTSFSPMPVPLNFPATDIKLQTDGKMILSGTRNADFALARYANASLDASFGVGGIATLDFGSSDSVNAIHLEPDGDILAGGLTFNSSSRKVFALARFKPNGSPDSTFGTGGKVITDFGGDAEILGLTRQNDGKIVAAGGAKLSLDRDYALARYLSGTAAQFDFDGDSKTDISIFRPSQGEWWYLKSSGGHAAFQFGTASDKPVPADFTGDGKTDIAIWRPSTGSWFVLRSEDSTFFAFPFGTNGDIPVPADYDGDGKADAAVFRPTGATWFVNKSSGGTIIQGFGVPTDAPVPADYDGDGKADLAIYRANGANQEWWYQKSATNTVSALAFGTTGDKAVQGDYTGDGKTDIAVWRPSNGNWYVLRSEDLTFFAFAFGTNGDIPTPGDYDGDGKTDAAVFRPSGATWYLNRSTAGVAIVGFGLSTDRPLPNAFVP